MRVCNIQIIYLKVNSEFVNYFFCEIFSAQIFDNAQNCDATTFVIAITASIVNILTIKTSEIF